MIDETEMCDLCTQVFYSWAWVRGDVKSSVL